MPGLYIRSADLDLFFLLLVLSAVHRASDVPSQPRSIYAMAVLSAVFPSPYVLASSSGPRHRPVTAPCPIVPVRFAALPLLSSAAAIIHAPPPSSSRPDPCHASCHRRTSSARRRCPRPRPGPCHGVRRSRHPRVAVIRVPVQDPAPLCTAAVIRAPPSSSSLSRSSSVVIHSLENRKYTVVGNICRKNRSILIYVLSDMNFDILYI